MSVTSWTIPGADEQAIIGNTHLPAGAPRGVLLISHGFKGYKDYGFMPYLARRAASAGFIAHRFNFSHSGMTDNIATFERPDLFERDTWGKQVHDLLAVAAAAHDGTLPGGQTPGVPAGPGVWFGHSRGGVTTILAAAKAFTERLPFAPCSIIPTSSPDTSCRLDEDQQKLMREHGYLDSPSARTGQNLRVGMAWLEEIEADPKAYDPQLAISRIPCPILVMHGSDDATIPADAARRLARTAGENCTCEIIEGASHTFNCPNPLENDADAPPQTQRMAQMVTEFLTACA